NVNYIITYAPDLRKKNPDSASVIDNILAQAYFLRALTHLDICLTYAQNYTYTSDASHLGVPVMTSIPVVTDKMRRSTVREVYSQIIADLEKALSTFTADYSFNEYFASPAACKALLARVYLYMNEYSRAASLSAEVMKEFPLTAREKYRNMFVNVATRGGESILRLNGYDQSDFISDLYYYESPSARPSAKLKELFTDERDVRLTLFRHTANSGQTGQAVDYDNVCMKFYCTDETTNKLDRHFDPFILRSSEMYLINAEANYELGNTSVAADDIKALEARALGVDASEVVIDLASLELTIQNERMKELCFEGHRLFDITRRHENLSRSRNSTSSVLFLKYPDYRFVLPIPYLELESNPEMEQNPSSN
ncbi:MAG: RagB/SusD family nutrient uptake outer membrane protein, partial [Anaerovoracaceae bacterium]